MKSDSNLMALDPLSLKENALLPVIGSLSQQDINALLKKINTIGEDRFLQFLIKNGLAPLWFDYLTDNDLVKDLPPLFVEGLKKQKIAAVASTLLQKNILKQVHELFESENIPYLIFKGCDLRYLIYDDPAQRPASDIDILILEKDKQQAVNVLTQAEFQLNINPATVSHEANLSKDSATIDLHWKLFRPGQTRNDLAEYLFNNTDSIQGYRGLNHQASLVVMLIHPVFTKQLNSPSSMLIHMVDLYKLLKQENIDWENILRTLDSSGAKTAAWCSLYWLKQLTNYCVPEKIFLKLKPGRLHEYYLRFWIDKDLINKLWRYRLIVKGLFDLALHDSIKDAMRAFLMHLREKRIASAKVKEIVGG